MDLSNKNLAMLLVAAMVVSLGATMVSLNKLDNLQTFTGPGTRLGIEGQVFGGYASINISDVVGCSVDSSVDLGDGSAPSSATIISSDANNAGAGFNDCTTGTLCVGLQVNNTGNTNLNVTFNSSQGASAFLGGPSVVAGDFQYSLRNGTFADAQPGCVNGSENGVLIPGFEPNANRWTNLDTTPHRVFCYNLTPSDANDMITLEFNVTARPDTPAGVKNATIQISCSQN